MTRRKLNAITGELEALKADMIALERYISTERAELTSRSRALDGMTRALRLLQSRHGQLHAEYIRLSPSVRVSDIPRSRKS